VGAFNPEWSPDGQWIAYSSLGSDANLWIIPSAGGTPRQITTHPGADTEPTWSPDGRKLAFVSDRSGNQDIWIIGIDGEDALQVTTDPAIDRSPHWSPDGMRIVFVSDRGDAGFSHIWMVSDLQTLNVEATSWSKMKRAYREE
jgi:TolB protein